jgi:hypothetical protein
VTLDFSNVQRKVQLEKGSVTSVLRQLDKVSQGSGFTVQTKIASAAVRGTSFCVWADASSTYVCACNGSVDTLDANGSNDQFLSSAHHVARLYSLGESGITMEEAGVKFHDDALVEAVAAKIGATIDWDHLEE